MTRRQSAGEPQAGASGYGVEQGGGRRIRVLSLIKGLGRGGAEMLLFQAVRLRDRDAFDYEVGFLLGSRDWLAEDLRAEGVPVHLFSSERHADFRWVLKLRRHLIANPVDVVHIHSPLVAAAARLVVRSLPRGYVRRRFRPNICLGPVTSDRPGWSMRQRSRSTRRTWRSPMRWQSRSLVGRGSTCRSWCTGYRFPTCEASAGGATPYGPSSASSRRGFGRHGSQRDRAEGVPRSDRSGEASGLTDGEPSVRGGRTRDARRRDGSPGRPIRSRRAAGATRRRRGRAPVHVGVRHLRAGVSLGRSSTRDHGGHGAWVAGRGNQVGGIPALVRDDREGTLVPNARPDLLAQAIEDLAADPERRARIGKTAGEDAVRFDNVVAVRTIEALYRDLFESGGRLRR